MKSFLLASAAVIALIAAPIAAAQYATPAPSYSVPQTEPNYQMPLATPADTYAAPATPAVEAAPPRAYDTPNVAEGQPGDVATADAESAHAVTTAEANAPATVGGHETPADAEISLAALQESARDAGMESLPMAPAQVCAPRTVNFEQSRLDRDARHQLTAAVDRASVCETRSVTIRAPESRAGAVRQALIAQGVDASKITVEAAAAGELEVDMAFNGVAASTPEYAALFNSGAQLASLDASDSATSDSAYAPTAFDPAAPADKNEGKPATYEL